MEKLKRSQRRRKCWRHDRYWVVVEAAAGALEVVAAVEGFVGELAGEAAAVAVVAAADVAGVACRSAEDGGRFVE